MYPISNDVLALFEAEQPKVLRITGTDKNGTAITITDNDVVADSFQLDRYACNGEKLEVGTAVAAQMTLKLFNGNGQFDDIVFEGTELNVEIGIADWSQASPVVTYVPCGLFTPDIQPRRMATISLTCLDRMTKFDVAVDATALTFPATVAGLVGQVCTVCGVTLAQSIATLPNADVSISALPSVNGIITYRNIIQWCAGIMATNAWMDWNGQLRFSWYNNSTSYVSTTDNRYSSDLYENDLTVTGVVYTNDSGIEIVEGTDDYALDLTGNALAGPLIATVLPAINTAVNGFAYRPFTAAVINAPYLWPMDSVVFTDKDGNNHASVLTNVAFGVNGTTALESKGMTEAINKLQAPVGVTKEQAQLISQAMEQVETDIDDSLTQQEIFNRLTDNGAAQGLVLLNGQLYVNATYLRSGTIDGGLVNAKLLNIVDADGNVIASFNDTIRIGNVHDIHVQIDYNSFELCADSGSNYVMSIGDMRNSEGVTSVKSRFVSDGEKTKYVMPYNLVQIESVIVNGSAVTDYIVSGNIIQFESAFQYGSVVEISYITDTPIIHYDLGIRYKDLDGNISPVGNFSVVEGVKCIASGEYSHAQGEGSVAEGLCSYAEGSSHALGDFSHAEGNGYAYGSNSHAEGNGYAYGSNSHAEGNVTTANGLCQHVFGEYNVVDRTASQNQNERGQYVEIVGNGTSTSLSNARTLDWSGNEWLAGALSVGDPAGTRANLGITPANIGALPDTTTAADIGALPDTTTAADIGASAAFVLTGAYTTAATIYSVLSTMARGSVATISIRAAASNAMCGLNYDMYGTIWRASASTSNNYYLSMTRPSGIEQYCYVLTLTASSMSHGTVYKYTGTVV